MMSFNCRKELNEMKSCMERWYNDENFRQECTKLYLEKRREFRLNHLKERVEKARREELEREQAEKNKASNTG